jgi:DNA-binding NtrC family response regulator
MGSGWAVRRQAPSCEIPFPFKRHFSAAARPMSVAVVSVDPEIRATMAEMLRGCSLTGLPANGFTELKSVYSEVAPIACLCGFDLADGTFHDVVDFLEDQSSHVPVIMIAPRAAEETPARFLDSLRAGALATICYPYRLSDVQIMLWSVIQYQRESCQLT